jgi:phenylalanyl-tRNA synthetase alpha chain
MQIPSTRHFSQKLTYNNIPPQIWDFTKRKLYKNPQHPLATLITQTEHFFNRPEGISDIPLNQKFKLFQDFDPIVKTHDCFDALRIPADHVSRAPTDTYYLDEQTLLRTHTSVHQIPILKQGHRNFLCMGDVYRKDTVDKTHYPVFH